MPIDWRGEQAKFIVVADMDDPDSPARMGTLDLANLPLA